VTDLPVFGLSNWEGPRTVTRTHVAGDEVIAVSMRHESGSPDSDAIIMVETSKPDSVYGGGPLTQVAEYLWAKADGAEIILPLDERDLLPSVTEETVFISVDGEVTEFRIVRHEASWVGRGWFQGWRVTLTADHIDLAKVALSTREVVPGRTKAVTIPLHDDGNTA
jgi:hypothetical protein